MNGKHTVRAQGTPVVQQWMGYALGRQAGLISESGLSGMHGRGTIVRGTQTEGQNGTAEFV